MSKKSFWVIAAFLFGATATYFSPSKQYILFPPSDAILKAEGMDLVKTVKSHTLPTWVGGPLSHVNIVEKEDHFIERLIELLNPPVPYKILPPPEKKK